MQSSRSYPAGFHIDKRLILFFRLYIMSHQLPSAISPHQSLEPRGEEGGHFSRDEKLCSEALRTPQLQEVRGLCVSWLWRPQGSVCPLDLHGPSGLLLGNWLRSRGGPLQMMLSLLSPRSQGSKHRPSTCDAAHSSLTWAGAAGGGGGEGEDTERGAGPTAHCLPLGRPMAGDGQ